MLFQALTGSGLPPSSFLVVPSSRVLVRFETDHLVSAQGFRAHFEPYSMWTAANVETSTMLACQAPAWDISTPSMVFASRMTQLQVLESVTSSVSKVHRSSTDDSWSTMPGTVDALFVHINRARFLSLPHFPVNSTSLQCDIPSWPQRGQAAVSVFLDQPNHTSNLGAVSYTHLRAHET